MSIRTICETPTIDCLPFVGPDFRSQGMPRSFWNVQPSGDYARDCETGRIYAEDALSYMSVTGSSPLLKTIVSAIVKDHMTGIEVGFLQVIAERAILGQSHA